MTISAPNWVAPEDQMNMSTHRAGVPTVTHTHCVSVFLVYRRDTVPPRPAAIHAMGYPPQAITSTAPSSTSALPVPTTLPHNDARCRPQNCGPQYLLSANIFLTLVLLSKTRNLVPGHLAGHKCRWRQTSLGAGGCEAPPYIYIFMQHIV